MSKIMFINTSPNKNGHTYQIGTQLLKNTNYDVLQLSDYQISQYGNISKDDQITEIFEQLKDKDTLVIGSPVYWYTVGGILKTFIDRLYLLPESKILKGKHLYFFAQGTGPDDITINTITHLITRVATLMEMDLKYIVVDTSDGNKIINTISLK